MTCERGGRRIEERDGGGTVKAQFVWSVDGQGMLRDRDNSASVAGLEQRLWAMHDRDGSTTGLVNASGIVQERYTYTIDGRPTIRQGNGAGQTDWGWRGKSLEVSNPADDWTDLWRGWRWKVLNNPALPPIGSAQRGLYDAGGGQWREPTQGRALQPSSLARAAGANGYDSGVNGWSVLAGAIRLVSWINPIVGLIVNTVGSAYERSMDGEDTGAALRHGFGDASGYTGAMRAWNNEDPYTGQQLNLGTGERWLEGTLSFMQLAGLGMSAAGGALRGAAGLNGASFNMPALTWTLNPKGALAPALAWSTVRLNTRAIAGMGGQLGALGSGMAQAGGIGNTVFSMASGGSSGQSTGGGLSTPGDRTRVLALVRKARAKGDTGVPRLISWLDWNGLRVKDTNHLVGNPLREVDIEMASGVIIQVKKTSSAKDIIEQVIATEGATGQAVIAFVVEQHRGATKIAQVANKYVPTTNNFQMLLDVLR